MDTVWKIKDDKNLAPISLMMMDSYILISPHFIEAFQIATANKISYTSHACLHMVRLKTQVWTHFPITAAEKYGKSFEGIAPVIRNGQ